MSTALPSPASHARYVARQPILEAKQHVVAYELLFRAGLGEAFGCDSALGIESLVGGKPMFARFTREVLLEDFALLLPPDALVVELPAAVAPDEEVVRACRRLKTRGYRLALDDFVWREEWSPLLELADIVKVDFRATRGEARAATARRLRRFDVKLLAQSVEMRSDFTAGLSAGYSWFQGFFFERPDIAAASDVRDQLEECAQNLGAVSSPSCDLRDVEEAVGRDVPLCLELLRVARSAAFGRPGRVDSIHDALSTLGLHEARKWIALFTLVRLAKDKPAELMRTALVRARFCEVLASGFALEARSTDLFLVGLFSLIDALLDRPMTQLLAEIPLARDVAEAVRRCGGPFGGPLAFAIAWERGDWSATDVILRDISADADALVDAYVHAVEWARGCGELVH